MSEVEFGRKHTWGNGKHVYTRVGRWKVYCHSTQTTVLAKKYLDNVTSYKGFRYLDEEVQPSKEIHEEARSKGPADDVRNPSHYQVFPDVESIEIIARSMTVAEFKGFCMGNVLKYRLRAGKKSELATMEKDLKKADFYKELFEQHKDKCYE